LHPGIQHVKAPGQLLPKGDPDGEHRLQARTFPKKTASRNLELADALPTLVESYNKFEPPISGT